VMGLHHGSTIHWDSAIGNGVLQVEYMASILACQCQPYFIALHLN